jgi:hypothetical protein
MEKKYTETIGRLQTERRKRKKKSQFLLSLKLVSFLAMAAFIYGACTMPYVLLFIALAVVCAAVYVFALIRDGRCIRDMERMDALIKACQNELGYLKGDFRAFDDGARYASPEHEFAYDLDIFGPDSLFQRINRTRTEEGSDRLARKLSVLETDIETIKANQLAINDLSGRFDWRLRFMAGEQVQSKFVQLCREMSSKSQGNAPISPAGKIQHLIPYASSALTLLALLGYICDWWPGVWFSLLFFMQLTVYIIRGKKMQHTILATDKLHHEFKGYLDLLREIQQEPFQAEALKHLQKQLFEGPENSIRAFRQLTRLQNLFDQRSNALMYVVLNGLFLYDLLLQRKFDEWMTRYLPHVEIWVDQVSEFDALVSLGNYAANNPNNTIPQILTEATDPVIRACDTYHPFLAHKHPVANSFTLDKKRIAIVTGANMAGKSTFLRTIGVNYILATTGAPVCAREFGFSIVSLFSSMRTADNLSRDISYFHAELLRLKQLIQHVRSQNYTLIILDEILKGTNSKDKLQGSILFLNEISRYNMSALIATHDLELARLEEKDASLYQNYCFEIELAHDIRYSYHIQKGVAQNLNASYLLQDILESCRQD